MPKNNDMFVTTSYTSIGCTFLEWSINYLAGGNSYYKVWPDYLKGKTDGTIPLVDNPLLKKNAHGHQRNHPATLEETKRVIGILRQQQGRLKSCYPFAQDGLQEHRLIIDFCLEESIPVVFVILPKELHLFHSIGKRSGTWRNGVWLPNVTELDSLKYFISDFFSDGFKEWDSSEIWDIRDILSLNFYKYNTIEAKIANTSTLEDIKDHNLHRVNGPMLWHSGEHVVPDLLHKLDLKLDEERFLKWRPVYYEWQKILKKTVVDFYYNLDFIVNSVVHNYNLDLTQFNMTLSKEIVLQAELIKQHNLTIKGWGLEKFPDNATDLHKLLEESFHKEDGS